MSKKFQVLYSMRISGSIDVTADSEEEAERIVVEDVSYHTLTGESDSGEIEIEDVHELKKVSP